MAFTQPLKVSCTTYCPFFTAPGAIRHAVPARSFRHVLTARPDELDQFESPTRAAVIPVAPIVTIIATLPRSDGSAFCPFSWKQKRVNDCSRCTASISAGGAEGIA